MDAALSIYFSTLRAEQLACNQKCVALVCPWQGLVFENDVAARGSPLPCLSTSSLPTSQGHAWIHALPSTAANSGAATWRVFSLADLAADAYPPRAAPTPIEASQRSAQSQLA